MDDADEAPAWTLAPFRADRTPPSARYVEGGLPARPSRPEPSPEDDRGPDPPSWTLRGVVLGPPSFGLVEGTAAAGATVRVVAVDDTVGGFRIERIDPDGIVVSREGRTWTIALEDPWK